MVLLRLSLWRLLVLLPEKLRRNSGVLRQGLLSGRLPGHLRCGMHLRVVSNALVVGVYRRLVVRYRGVWQCRQLRLHLLAMLLHVHFLHSSITVVQETGTIAQSVHPRLLWRSLRWWC